jgi:hypothetical protein
MWKKYMYILIGGIVLGALFFTACQPTEEEPVEPPREEDLINPPAFTCKPTNGERICKGQSLEGEDGEVLKIKVTIPQDTDQVWDVVVQTEPIDLELQEMLAKAELPFGEEASLTLVTNLKIVMDPESEKENPPLPIKPPIILEVEYTAQQWQDASGKEFASPRLVFFNQDTGQWEEFPEQDLISREGDELENGGYIRIEIKEWLDPPIGLVS